MSSILYIGRFQPFHLGHLSAIKQILKQADHLIIGMGSSQYDHQPQNPFTAEERRAMIEGALKAEDLEEYCEIVLIPDIHNDEKWVEHVTSLTPKFETVFVGAPGMVQTLFERAGIPVRQVKRELNVSATQIRHAMMNDEEWESSVPASVASYLHDLQAIKRLKTIEGAAHDS